MNLAGAKSPDTMDSTDVDGSGGPHAKLLDESRKTIAALQVELEG